VIVGEKVNIHGAEFEFDYSFHTIPTIRFKLSFLGKSVSYSSDSYYNPQVVFVFVDAVLASPCLSTRHPLYPSRHLPAWSLRESSTISERYPFACFSLMLILSFTKLECLPSTLLCQACGRLPFLFGSLIPCTRRWSNDAPTQT